MNIFEKRIEIKPYEYPELLQYKDAIRHSYWLHCVRGNQRVPTELGLKKVVDLFNYGQPFKLFDGEIIKSSNTPMLKTAYKDVYRIYTKEGLTHDVTIDHRVMTNRGWVEAGQLINGDKLHIQLIEGVFGNKEDRELAYLLGHYQGDGTGAINRIEFHIWEHEYELCDTVEYFIKKVYDKYNLGKKLPKFGKEYSDNKRKLITKKFTDFNFQKAVVPEWIWEGNKETIVNYILGLFHTDGTCYQSKKYQSVKWTNNNYEFVKNIQLLLLNLGIQSKIYTNKKGWVELPNGKGGKQDYFCKDTYTLEITNQQSVVKFQELTDFFTFKGKKFRLPKNTNKSNPILQARFTRIEKIGTEEVYCINLKSNPQWICNGFITHNTEYNLTGDIHNYKVGISDTERNCIKNAMLAVAQIEVAVKTFWGDIYKRLPKPEIADVGYTFAESEVRHKDAYSFLLDRLGLNKDFEKIHEIPAIIDRMNYLNKYLSGSKSKKDEDYALTILLFSLFIEHVSLFSQFLIIMSFNKHKNLFKGMSNIVEATSKEETIHAQFGIEIIRIIKKEHPEWFGEEKEKLVETLCKKAYKAEKKVLSWILEAGELDFISEAVIDNFIRQRFNEALEAIGFQTIFEVNQEQLADIEWFELEMLSTKDYDFFNKRPVDYSKKTKTFSSNNLF